MPNKKVTISYNNKAIVTRREITSSNIIYNNTEIQADFVGTKTLNCNN